MEELDALGKRLCLLALVTSCATNHAAMNAQIRRLHPPFQRYFAFVGEGCTLQNLIVTKLPGLVAIDVVHLPLAHVATLAIYHHLLHPDCILCVVNKRFENLFSARRDTSYIGLDIKGDCHNLSILCHLLLHNLGLGIRSATQSKN